jgi:N-acetylglucosaminyl-diphospho-decaprenol L-rhamnosyltransferase
MSLTATDSAVRQWPNVTVVILAFKRLDRLRETLRHTLDGLDYPREALELIVVDNASENGTPEMLAAEFPEVRVIVLPENVGTSGWNAGLVAGTGAWTLMLDDDGHLAGDDLKRAVSAAEAHAADLVSFRVRSGLDPSFYFYDEYPTGLLSFWGTAVLLTRRAIEATGGFDPNVFIWGNELELTIRLLDAGMRHLHMPEIVAIHMKAPTPPRGEGKFEASAYRMNQRNLSYVSARSLQWRDAVAVLGNRVLRVLLDVHALDRRALDALPQIVRGTLAGVRARRPVRPELSTLYRRNFPDFASPLIFMRGPVARLRARSDAERAERDRLARLAQVYAARRAYFPAETAVLAV